MPYQTGIVRGCAISKMKKESKKEEGAIEENGTNPMLCPKRNPSQWGHRPPESQWSNLDPSTNNMIKTLGDFKGMEKKRKCGFLF